MAALGIDVQLGRYLGILKSEKIDDSIFYMDRIVLGLHQERWRGLIGWVNVGIRRVVLVREREIARIDNYGKVRAAT